MGSDLCSLALQICIEHQAVGFLLQDLAARPWDIPRSLDGGKIFKALSKGMGVIDSKLLADVPDAEHAS